MEALLDLIPHRPPWLLVDRVIRRDTDAVAAERLIAADDPLLARDGLPELLVLEALAQTAACLNAGALGRHRGLLVAATQVELDGRPQPGDLLALVARKTATLGKLVRFDAEARIGERVIARAQMTFAIEEER